MFCVVANQTEKKYACTAVLLPSVQGPMMVLPFHEPMVVLLLAGEVKVALENTDEIFYIDGGCAHIEYDGDVTTCTIIGNEFYG